MHGQKSVYSWSPYAERFDAPAAVDLHLDLSALAAEMDALGDMIENIEAGRGADGVGHGRRVNSEEGQDPDRPVTG